MACGTILVVKDHLLNRELTGDLLEGAGYTVLQADDGGVLIDRVTAERHGLIQQLLQGQLALQEKSRGVRRAACKVRPWRARMTK